MEDTWTKYQKSLVTIKGNLPYTAEYEYSLNDISLKTAEEGIEALTKIAPFVLAFNDKLGIIEITDQSRKLKFELVKGNNEPDGMHKIVKEEGGEKPPENHELLILRDDVDIAVKRKKQDDGTYRIESLRDVPKIFLAFPLFGTQDLPFPVVVNSRRFEPTERRDGIFLGKENTDEINRNRSFLENASELFIKLISNTCFNGWENPHILLNLGDPPIKEWLDKDGYRDLLKNLINEIMDVEVFKTENGDFISPNEGIIPIIESGEKEEIEKLWDLCHQFLIYKDKMPAKALAIEWVEIFGAWKSLGLNLTDSEITIEKLAEEIERCKDLQSFKTKLAADADELNTLNAFYEILLEVEREGLFDSKNILPNQNGTFKKKPELLRDDGIDEKLKDISNKLEEDTRNLLLHSRISESIQNLLPTKKQDEVLNEVVSKIKRQPQPEGDQYLQANMELFKWLLEHDNIEYFEGYPILSSKDNIFAWLGKENKEKLLAPKNVWNEIARDYDSLFPQDFIFSSLYYEEIAQKEKWDKLGDEGLILTNPLYKDEEKLSQEVLESLLLPSEELEEEKEHEAADDVVVSKIAFLETQDKGIIATIRKSKDKARKFLDFLLKYVVEVDTQWNSPLEVNCECGTKHKIYPAFWLATLKNRSWVPVHKNKSEKPNAHYLALLLEDHEELLQNCREDNPSRFLNKLNVGIGELTMCIVAKDEKTKLELEKAMSSLFGTFMANPSNLSKIAQLAENEKELFISEIEERIRIREQIRRNQSLGSLIENLLKTVLENEGFKVERTGVGSDFVIEYDFVEDDMETIIEIKREERLCFYIEVKATSQDFVRMTLTQAKEARDKSDKYVLCVIKLTGLEMTEDNIKSNICFVEDIGKKIQDKVIEAENLKQEQEIITEAGDIEIEISGGPIRFKIHKKIWEEGKSFEQFIGFLRK
ncbi:MAG TPA: hypothetical protein VMW40_07115 [Candidatus Bathyarchaeia archaeon]|nr:hypothetical protein [Candidatus Bathyarchaeia archaeon]